MVLDLSADDRSELAIFLSRAKTRAIFEKWQRSGFRGGIYNRTVLGGIGDRPITEFFLSLHLVVASRPGAPM